MTVPACQLPGRSAPNLLAAAHTGLDTARGCGGIDPAATAERYIAAHLAALRAAAAVLAARARPGIGHRTRGRPPTVWTLLAHVAPEMGEWAAFFAASARRRADAEAGRAISAREADDLVRAAAAFTDLVTTTLGLTAALPVPGTSRPAPAGPR